MKAKSNVSACPPAGDLVSVLVPAADQFCPPPQPAIATSYAGVFLTYITSDNFPRGRKGKGNTKGTVPSKTPISKVLSLSTIEPAAP